MGIIRWRLRSAKDTRVVDGDRTWRTVREELEEKLGCNQPNGKGARLVGYRHGNQLKDTDFLYSCDDLIIERHPRPAIPLRSERKQPLRMPTGIPVSELRAARDDERDGAFYKNGNYYVMRDKPSIQSFMSNQFMFKHPVQREHRTHRRDERRKKIEN